MLSLLENLANELLYKIFDRLASRDGESGRREIKDICNLRLASKTVGAVADAIFMHELLFFPCSKRDVDMVLSFANHPVYRNYPTTLALALEMMSRDRISSLEYIGAIRAEWKKINNATKNPSLRLPQKSEGQIMQGYHLYLRLFDEQNQMLDNASEIFEELAAKFPHVRELVVSANNHLRFAKSPFQQCRYDIHADLMTIWDRNDLLNQAAELFKAFSDSKQLRTIQIGAIHYSFFDPITCTAGKHCMMGNFATNITTLKLVVLAYKDESGTVHPSALQVAGTEEALGECREVLGKGVLRSVVDHMSNLETLTVRFVEEHAFDMGTFEAPATLSSVISPNRVWPKLRQVAIENVKTNRHELASFIALHKGSLESVSLQSIRFVETSSRVPSTSWTEFLLDLKHRLQGARLNIFLKGILRGKSEDGEGGTEGWNLGGEIGIADGDDDDDDEDDEDTMLRIAITRYFKSSEHGLSCPLTKENMDWAFGEISEEGLEDF